jgi:sortase A
VRKLSRKKVNKGVVMMILGIAVMAVPFIMRWIGEYRSNQYISQFEEDKDEEQDKENPSHKKEKDALLNEEGVIGIIEIPSLKLKYPVFEGAGQEQLNNGIGHMTETSNLCEVGNCVLCGHNGSRRGTYFTYLNTIEIGATVEVTNQDMVTHEYEVVETKIVDPYNAAVREQTTDETLTLFTCAYHGTQRFVVICKRKGGDAGANTGDTSSDSGSNTQTTSNP